MCPLKESQKGPRPSIQGGKTSLIERPQKLRKLPTHEQGTDTEQEKLNRAFGRASQRYQRLLQPYLGENRRVDCAGQTYEDKLQDMDQCTTERDSQPRCSTTCENELEREGSGKAKGNLLSMIKTKGSKYVLPLCGPERGIRKEMQSKWAKISDRPMQDHCKENERVNQAEECLLIKKDNKAVVDVFAGTSQVEPECKYPTSRKSDAVLSHVSTGCFEEVFTSSKAPPSHESDSENVQPHAKRYSLHLPRSKVFISPERPLCTAYDTIRSMKDSAASVAMFNSMFTEVKKGLEAHIRSTEQKVDKQRDKTAVLADQRRRVQVQSQHLQNELAEAQIMSQHYKSKSQFKEDEGHILLNKIREAEEALATKLRTAKGHLEGRLERSQRVLEETEAERQASLREIRQLEKLVTEKTKQAEEERKLGREFQESKDKIDQHIKKLEACLYDAKLECSLEKARRMDIERQVNEALDEQARLKRELVGCSELGSPWSVIEASNRDKHGAHPSSVAALRSALR